MEKEGSNESAASFDAEVMTMLSARPIRQSVKNSIKGVTSTTIKWPRRAPSVVKKERQPVYITADKTTCAECPCFKDEAPYEAPPKIRMCQFSPRTLYELAARVVDSLPYPHALNWTAEEVATWIANVVGFPQYKECFLKNKVNGRKLLAFEDPSLMPMVNIRYLEHMKVIAQHIRRLFNTEYVWFNRSIGLPPRKPLTHCTWIKKDTCDPHGHKINMTRSDMLRYYHIINPVPTYMNHWDLVWYVKPDFPKTLFGWFKKPPSQVHIPHYKKKKDICYEAQVPRKFKVQSGIKPKHQLIWVDTRKYDIKPQEEAPIPGLAKKMKKKHLVIPKETRLYPKRVSLTGCKGKELTLARRLQPSQKFFPILEYLPPVAARLPISKTREKKTLA